MKMRKWMRLTYSHSQELMQVGCRRTARYPDECAEVACLDGSG
jgi:hypothetical protein